MRRIEVLLYSRFDYLPQPRNGDAVTNSGPAEGKRVPCERCRRSGRVLDRVHRRMIPCVACAGTGWRRRRGAEPAWDEYTGEPLAESVRTSRVFTSRELDHEIAKLERDELERRGIVAHLRYSWERARLARDHDGSYRELERALERLPYGVSPVSRGGLEWLSAQMPRTIHVPEWANQDLAEARRDVVLACLAEGRTQREVGRALGVSAEKVGRIAKEARRR